MQYIEFYIDISYPYICKTTVQSWNKNVLVVTDYTNYVLEGRVMNIRWLFVLWLLPATLIYEWLLTGVCINQVSSSSAICKKSTNIQIINYRWNLKSPMCSSNKMLFVSGSLRHFLQFLQKIVMKLLEYIMQLMSW